MDLGLKGLNVLVTGGTKGIGRRTAEIFADEGANVSLCARNAKEVDETVDALKKRGVKAFGQAIDVGKKAEIEGWVEASAKALGGIDIVIANVSALAAAEDTEASWNATYNVDMMHTVRSVNSAMTHLEKSKSAAIVVVSSVSGREVDFTSPAYGAIKSALIHYAQGLAYKLAPKNIRVNSVSPGNTYFKGGVWNYIEENMPDLFKSSLAMNPTGRMAKPEEIGRAIVFLASPASSFTMGTNLVIDGALTKGVQY
jgi:3-oxoacyl-[acyl-carrier protein] reductase